MDVIINVYLFDIFRSLMTRHRLLKNLGIFFEEKTSHCTTVCIVGCPADFMRPPAPNSITTVVRQGRIEIPGDHGYIRTYINAKYLF